jgi:indole-3-glycerol phosphate synthase
MENYLIDILKQKEVEVRFLKERKTFKERLKNSTLSVIAEVKRSSPSKGFIAEISDPVFLANLYVSGGAAAVSVLTESSGFGGCVEDIKKIKLANPNVCVLRKDFIIDLVQIEESVRIGADAVLLIVSILKERTKEFLDKVKQMGMEALVEVHDEEELAIALQAGAEIIGVNNRDLKTFEVDLQTAERLAPLIPEKIVKVAESGIHTNLDAKRMRKAGFDAILVGEALVKAVDPEFFLQDLMHES